MQYVRFSNLLNLYRQKKGEHITRVTTNSRLLILDHEFINVANVSLLAELAV